ncbi:MAG: hypothetical protein ABTR07_08480 [Candidatus Competibacter denitrificans]
MPPVAPPIASGAGGGRSPIAPILPADLEQSACNLPQRAAAHRIAQHREQVFVVDRVLRAAQLRR